MVVRSFKSGPNLSLVCTNNMQGTYLHFFSFIFSMAYLLIYKKINSLTSKLIKIVPFGTIFQNVMRMMWTVVKTLWFTQNRLFYPLIIAKIYSGTSNNWRDEFSMQWNVQILCLSYDETHAEIDQLALHSTHCKQYLILNRPKSLKLSSCGCVSSCLSFLCVIAFVC